MLVQQKHNMFNIWGLLNTTTSACSEAQGKFRGVARTHASLKGFKGLICMQRGPNDSSGLRLHAERPKRY